MERSADEILRGIEQVGRDSNRELRRVIARLMEGDTAELVRHVVEVVTDAMHTASIGYDIPEQAIADMIAAKFAAFKEITGQEYTTTTNRMLEMRREMRKAKEAK